MVGTILPIVYGERQQRRFPVNLALHTLGYVLGAIIVGGSLGALGAALPWQALPPVRSFVSHLAIGIVGLLYSLRELELIRVPAPQFRQQVPAKWRLLLPVRATAFLYGLGLGIGWATYIPVSTFYVLAVWAVLTGSPILAASGMALFGFGRALPIVWLARRRESVVEAFRLTRAVSGWQPVVHLANGLILAFAGSSLLLSGLAQL